MSVVEKLFQDQMIAVRSGRRSCPESFLPLFDVLERELNVRPFHALWDPELTGHSIYIAVLHLAGQRVLSAASIDHHLTHAGYPPQLLPRIRDLETVGARIANRALAEAEPGYADAIAARFQEQGVHSVSTINGADHTVFFTTIAAHAAAHESGVTATIRQQFLQLLQSHDIYGCVTPDSLSLQFDTKESLDRDFGGNLWHYYR